MKYAPAIDDAALESERRRGLLSAILFGAALVVVAAAATPYVRQALFPLPGYMLAFGTTMIVTNVILGSLLLSRGKAEDDGSTILLGTVYLFVGLIFLPMTAAFPGALSAGPLIGTTFSAIWIWTIWHAGFGIGIVAYSSRYSAIFKMRPLAAFASVSTVVCVVAVAATSGVDFLPRIFGDPMRGMFSGPGEFVGWALLAIDAWAFVAAASRARESSERLWLAVAMVAACFDVWLTFKSGARFSVGWYLGKIGSLATTMVVLVALVNNLSTLYRSSRSANEALANLAKLDGLTGARNRRGFDESLAAECRRAARHSQKLALLMVDVDHFKLYNDRYGHQQGDECLRAIASALAANARRPGDTVSRYGGEEFAVLLPHTDLGGALLVANRILSSLAELAMPHADAASGFVSLSVGVACGDGKDSAALVGEADRFLYEAKRAGRCCVRHADVWLLSESLAREEEELPA